MVVEIWLKKLISNSYLQWIREYSAFSRGYKNKIPEGLIAEIIIVDDSSPDGTDRLIANYIDDPRVCAGIQQRENGNNFAINRESVAKLVCRENKSGLIFAILQPDTVPVLIKELLHNPNCIVVA
jgi:glycosyltransferase involved in cell wall biosynthesis